MKMVKQFSAGAVIYRVDNDESRSYLLLQYPGKYWDFPKGKLELGENWKDAALREIEEETGLIVTLYDNFEYKYTYIFNDFKGNKIEKTVVFFISKVDRNVEVKLSYEHIDYLWLPFEQARLQIHFETVRKLLTKVEIFLKQKYNDTLLG